MKKVSVFGILFLAAMFLTPYRASSMELPQLLDTIWSEAEIVRNPEGAWMPYSLRPGIMDTEEVIRHSYNFSCNSYGLVCGGFFANLSMVPGHGTIWLEVVLAEAGITVRSPWGRIPVRVLLKTTVYDLGPSDLGRIAQVIMAAREMTLEFGPRINLDFGYSENPGGASAPPTNLQITGRLTIVGAEIR